MPSRLATAIHSSGRQIVLAVTGGGSGAIAALLQTPGASRSILEARVPYTYDALVQWLAGPPDQACSEPTARAMAMAAWMRARKLTPGGEAGRLLGVGCTASLASDRPKRGDHRIYVAVQSADSTRSWSLVLPDKLLDRAAEEEIATSLILAAIAEVAGIEAAFPDVGEVIESRSDADPAWTELLLGARSHVVISPRGAADSAAPLAIFPGAFNPPHDAHRAMATVAERRLRQPVSYEISIHNVDKPPLDFIAIADRVSQLRREPRPRPILLTAAPTFQQKAALFPGATFLVGADTLVRIAEPRYYGGDAARSDEAVREIAAHGCRFLVFGRVVDGRFQSLAELNLPPALAAICDEVPAAEFRDDVSSTVLRAAREN